MLALKIKDPIELSQVVYGRYSWFVYMDTTLNALFACICC